MVRRAELAADAMRRGGVVVYPTETVWGIGCDARRPEAVARVMEIKGRPGGKGLIVLMDSVAMLRRYVTEIPDVAVELIEQAVEPLTIVYDGAEGLAEGVAAADGTVAVRVTADPLCRLMVKALRAPVVSTSANLSGMPAPRTRAELDGRLTAMADYVVETDRADEAASGRPSTIIRLGRGGLFEILRR